MLFLVECFELSITNEYISTLRIQAGIISKSSTSVTAQIDLRPPPFPHHDDLAWHAKRSNLFLTRNAFDEYYAMLQVEVPGRGGLKFFLGFRARCLMKVAKQDPFS